MNALRWAPLERCISPAGQFWGDTLHEPRRGVALHYDASSSDASGLAWLTSAEVKASYHLLVFDDGSWARLAPLEARAWHMGECRPGGRIPYTDANSALYGIAILNGGKEDVTVPQLLTVAWLTRRLFDRHAWPATDTWRITTHSVEAWPRGRKTDPEGPDPLNPILSADDVRAIVPLWDFVEAL